MDMTNGYTSVATVPSKTETISIISELSLCPVQSAPTQLLAPSKH